MNIWLFLFLPLVSAEEYSYLVDCATIFLLWNKIISEKSIKDFFTRLKPWRSRLLSSLVHFKVDQVISLLLPFLTILAARLCNLSRCWACPFLQQAQTESQYLIAGRINEVYAIFVLCAVELSLRRPNVHILLPNFDIIDFIWSFQVRHSSRTTFYIFCSDTLSMT